MKTKAITVAMATIAATISVAACSTSTRCRRRRQRMQRHIAVPAGNLSDNGGIPTNRAAVYTQTELPQFLHATLMTDPAGAVWVQDGGHDKLVKLAVGPDAQTELPLPILGMHGDVLAVDSAGNVYGANGGGVDPNGGCCLAVHVVTQAVGSDTPTVLPFDGIDKPIRVTVDTAGNVYVVDGGHRRVLKLAPSASN
jgi:hypothetical protein